MYVGSINYYPYIIYHSLACKRLYALISVRGLVEAQLRYWRRAEGGGRADGGEKQGRGRRAESGGMKAESSGRMPIGGSYGVR